MILTPHILIGAAIGSKIANLWLVALFSLAAHFLLEIIPHKEYNINALKNRLVNKEFYLGLTKVSFDFLLGFSLGLYLSFNSPYFNYVIIGMIFAIVPDFLLFLYWQYNTSVLTVVSQLHRAFHSKNNKNTPLWQGILFQVIVSAIALLILIS